MAEDTPKEEKKEEVAPVEKVVVKEDDVADVTVEGLESGKAKYELASRMLTLITDRKSWFLYISTFAFFYFNLTGKGGVFTSDDLLITYGIVGGTSILSDLKDMVKKKV